MSRRRRFWPGAAFALACLALWEAASRSGLVSPLYFPPVTAVAATMAKLTFSGLLPGQAAITLGRALAGLGLAAAAMIPLGLFMGMSRRLAALLTPTLEVLRPLPPPAVIPAAMLLLGIGEGMKVFVIFFACSFPILISAMDGARNVEPGFLLSAAVLGASKKDLAFRVTLPAAGPAIAAGVVTAVPMALIVAVLAEMIGATSGLGHYILRMQRTFSIPEMYAGVAWLGFIGLGLNALCAKAVAGLLGWYDGWKGVDRDA